MAEAKNNLLILKDIRVRGEAIKAGSVIPKSRFGAKGDWQNLCHMDPPRAEETSDAAKTAKASKAAPKAAAMPDAS